MRKLAHRIDPIVTAETILSEVSDMLKHEEAFVIGVANYALFRRGHKSCVILMAGHAIQGSHAVINLVLHKTEIRQAVVEFRPGSHPRIKPASLVIRMTAIALVNLFDICMNPACEEISVPT
jgi:hypothetical protein